MKIKIMQKDIIGYLFLLIVAATCVAIGIKILTTDHPISGIFGLVLGVCLVAVTASMVLRKA